MPILSFHFLIGIVIIKARTNFQNFAEYKCQSGKEKSYTHGKRIMIIGQISNLLVNIRKYKAAIVFEWYDMFC